MTYRAPTLSLSAEPAANSVPSEQEYIKSLAARSAFDPAAPVEVYVHRELTNPHSRAKKQQRWQAFQAWKKNLLGENVAGVLLNTTGATRRNVDTLVQGVHQLFASDSGCPAVVPHGPAKV